MNKIVSIHQPNYFPWLGYFHKIKKSDIFILMDNAQYTKGSWINRSKVKNKNNWQWLTVPVITSNSFGQKIKDAKIDYKKKWVENHLGIIRENYKETPHFKDYYFFIKEILEKNIENLSDLNIEIIKKIMNLLEIKTKIIKGSTLNVKGKSTDLLVSMTKAVEGDIYLSGNGSDEYLDSEKFNKNNLKLIFQEFKHPVYRQNSKEFIPGLSIIDALMNCGIKNIKNSLE